MVQKASLRKKNGRWILTIPWRTLGVKTYDFRDFEQAAEAARESVLKETLAGWT